MRGMWSLRVMALVLLPLLCLLSLLLSLSFYETWCEHAAPLAAPGPARPVAVIYAGPTFHEEVVSSVACMLHDLNYHTLVIVGSGLYIGGMRVPLSGRRKRSSMQFYGHCVRQWGTVDPTSEASLGGLRLPARPALLLFITYPMHTKGFVRDAAAFALLRRYYSSPAPPSASAAASAPSVRTASSPSSPHFSSSSSSFSSSSSSAAAGGGGAAAVGAGGAGAAAGPRVVLLTHRVGEMLHPLLGEIEAIVGRRRIVLLFLGEHTMKVRRLIYMYVYMYVYLYNVHVYIYTSVLLNLMPLPLFPIISILLTMYKI